MAAKGVLFLVLVLACMGTWLLRVWNGGNAVMSDELVKFDRLRSVASYADIPKGKNSDAGANANGELFLQGKTQAMVSADLLTQLKQMASAHGVEVVRAGDLPPKTEGPVTLVGGSVEMSGGIANIFDFIQDIERARPLLFVDHLSMRASGVAEAEEKYETPLAVEVQVFGAIRSQQLPSIGKRLP